MEATMKKLIFFVVIATLTLGLGTNLNALSKDYEEWLLDTAEENYVLLCKKGCPTVTESVILNIIVMKANYPDFDYTKITKSLDKIVQSHESTVVRHKAYIASMYLRHPELFNLFSDMRNTDRYAYFKKVAQDPNAFFRKMALELENTLFVNN